LWKAGSKGRQENAAVSAFLGRGADNSAVFAHLLKGEMTASALMKSSLISTNEKDTVKVSFSLVQSGIESPVKKTSRCDVFRGVGNDQTAVFTCTERRDKHFLLDEIIAYLH